MNTDLTIGRSFDRHLKQRFGEKSSKGFTLMEFLIAGFILAVVVMLAVPAFIGIVEEFDTDGKQRGLISGLKYAQSEAVKRNDNVSMCVSSTVTADSCDTTVANNWDQGWYIFVDDNGDGVIDGGTDTILRDQAPADSVSFITAVDINLVTFNGTGSMSAGANTTFTLCPKDSSNLDCSDTDKYQAIFSSLFSGQLVPQS